MWFLFAVLSSVFAALTSILAKVGMQGVDSALATALRTAVVLAMSWVMVFVAGKEQQISAIAQKAGCLLFCRAWQRVFHGFAIFMPSKTDLRQRLRL